MSKYVVILGSTGSIGSNTLRVLENLGPEYEAWGLSAHTRMELLAQQIKTYHPRVVTVTQPERIPELLDYLDKPCPCEILSGPEGLIQCVEHPDVDIVLTAIVGAAGLPSVLAAAAAGKRLAIANKEPLVVAGELLTQTAQQNHSTLLPVDSEHSAIFQALQAGRREQIQRLILTGSGGPFRQSDRNTLQNITLEQALNHPTWDMGPKITIDSATLMNKALEIIEARWLFGVPVEAIDVLIHPESIVHSLVEFVDGSMVAQLSEPDMCLPIQYALTYPERKAGLTQRLRLEDLGHLTFEKPNRDLFRAIDLAYHVARTGGTAAAVMNAANEAAVQAFMERRIGFLRITELIEDCLQQHQVRPAGNLETLMEADRWARDYVKCHLDHPTQVTKP